MSAEVKEMAVSSSCNVDNVGSIPLQEKELDECRRQVKELEAENYINEQTIRKLQDQSEVIRQIVILTTTYRVIAVTNRETSNLCPRVSYLPVPWLGTLSNPYRLIPPVDSRHERWPRLREVFAYFVSQRELKCGKTIIWPGLFASESCLSLDFDSSFFSSQDVQKTGREAMKRYLNTVSLHSKETRWHLHLHSVAMVTHASITCTMLSIDLEPVLLSKNKNKRIQVIICSRYARMWNWALPSHQKIIYQGYLGLLEGNSHLPKWTKYGIFMIGLWKQLCSCCFSKLTCLPFVV